MFHATWNDFQANFKPILSDLRRHHELLDCSASLVQIQESRDARIQSQISFDVLMKDQNFSKTRMVINWLSAADPQLDQEACVATREDFPGTARWILKHPMVRDWLDPTECSVPSFWLSGIPGAGKLNFTSVSVSSCHIAVMCFERTLRLPRLTTVFRQAKQSWLLSLLKKL